MGERPATAALKDQLIRHWMYSCLPMALVVAAMLVSTGSKLSLALIAVWGQFIAYLVHESEEHVLPGGFKDYVNHRVAGPVLQRRFPTATFPEDFPLDDRAVFWINISFIWIAFPVFAMLAGTVDIRFGLLLPWFGIVNASLHIAVAIAKRGYNPGLVVSLLINIPTGIWTLMILSDAGASAGDQVLFLALALLGHAALIGMMMPRIRRVIRSSR